MEISLKQSISLEQKTRTSYNKRNVRYEDIHNLDESSFCDFITMFNIINNNKILDHGCGYGAVTKEICKHFADEKIYFTLQDISLYQIERAKKELSGINDNKFFEFLIKKLKFCNIDRNYFDIAFSKLVLQEMPIIEQIEEIIELRRVVKDNGTLVFWVLWPSKEYTPFFRDIIKEKDKIARLTTLVKNRYFADPDEFSWILSKAGIDKSKDVEFLECKPLIYETKKQLSGDFKNDISSLMTFNEYIRKRSSKETLKNLDSICYSDNGDNIKIHIPQKIIIIRNKK